jgi:cobalt-zinc-cadmium efflux system outer membrane protein
MLKSILILGLLCTFLSADNFDNFLQKAIKNSTYLESNLLSIKQAQTQGEILNRYQNPSLEVEYSKFSPSSQNSYNGYRVNYTQPIRLWGVSDDNKALTSSIVKNTLAIYSKNKALFIKNISIAFTKYVQDKILLKLSNEELKIAKNIYNISSARYDNGTISRSLMLQAKIDYDSVQIKNEKLKSISIDSYYNLLQITGIKQEIDLNPSHTFNILTNDDNSNNPELLILKSVQDKVYSQAKLNSNKVSWINIFLEYETEMEQDITRFGVNIPLAIFDKKSQEKQLASIQVNRSKLLILNEKKSINITNKKLKLQRQSLQRLKLKHKHLLISELELLDMFANGYKIANINLLQLQDIKNKVISTKRNIILINTKLDINALNTNYNQGLYND